MFWCCCKSETGVPCDSYITGYLDNFDTLQQAADKGGWLWSVPIGVTPTVAPVGKLNVTYDSTQVGIPSNFFRCAQWNAQQTWYRYRMQAEWAASGSVQLFGALSGVAVTASFYGTLAGNLTYSVYHWVGFERGIGWRNKLHTDVNGSVFTAWNGPVVQVAESPVPQGPFVADFGMRLARNAAGQWQMFAQWEGADVGTPRSIVAPDNAGLQFSHGFSLQFDLVSAVVDSWQYEAVQT